ncbi:uncharacterized protein PGTG_02001 [Puccinia graminis f. sp. tritici CRL 75-36-700-3]|uniref:Uncharacterized protein n=1 Tax=Puccinia graminis f. sp. tritici (strain CRL 75-36-700-3 / race SCCL) TaxID=418459 RepID=E3JTN3_PUCGT|nr:uncharacterized protein PGTG_02001 [Puccinia graminis f. sp. tritici CRL 75-36-700-3]EFP75408.1 hypothetical protein PGTG_02001 [Puccinia graminis f. sp. tritici CRL 75-36-700-3]
MTSPTKQERPLLPFSTPPNVTSPVDSPPLRYNLPGFGIVEEIQTKKLNRQDIGEKSGPLGKGPNRPTGKAKPSLGTEWTHVPKRHSARIEREKQTNKPKVKATRPNAKKKPTAEDFRTTHHDAMDIDPQLTKNGPADDEPEPSKEVTKRQDQTEPPKGVTKSPDENDPKKPLSPKVIKIPSY